MPRASLSPLPILSDSPNPPGNSDSRSYRDLIEEKYKILLSSDSFRKAFLRETHAAAARCLAVCGPERASVIKSISNFIGSGQNPLPTVLVVGPLGSGKSTLALTYIKELGLPYSFIDCVALSHYTDDTRHQKSLHHFILSPLNKWFPDFVFPQCRDAGELVPAVHALAVHAETREHIPGIVFILYHPKYLLKSYSAIFYCFLNMRRLVATWRHTSPKVKVSVVMLSWQKFPSEWLDGTVALPTVQLEGYTADDANAILVRNFQKWGVGAIEAYRPDSVRLIRSSADWCLALKLPEGGEEYLSSERLSELWRLFVKNFLIYCHRNMRGDFRHLIFAAKHLWILFLLPVFNRTVSATHPDKSLEMKFRGHVKAANDSCTSRFVGDLYNWEIVHSAPTLASLNSDHFEAPPAMAICILGSFLAAALSVTNARKIIAELVASTKPTSSRNTRVTKLVHYTQAQRQPFTLPAWRTLSDAISVYVTKHPLGDKAATQMAALMRRQIVRPSTPRDGAPVDGFPVSPAEFFTQEKQFCIASVNPMRPQTIHRDSPVVVPLSAHQTHYISCAPLPLVEKLAKAFGLNLNSIAF